MRLTRRQEMILDDGLGCGSHDESVITANLIEAIKKHSAMGGYKSKAFDTYFAYHKNEEQSHWGDDWWDEDMKEGSKKDCYHGILELLVDLIDYSEYEDDKYEEYDNGNVYGKSQLNDSDLTTILDGYDSYGYIDADEQKVADKIKVHLYGEDSVNEEEN